MFDKGLINENTETTFYISFYPQWYLCGDCELIILIDRNQAWVRKEGQKKNTYTCLPIDDLEFLAVKDISVRIDVFYKSKVELIEEILPSVEALARAIEEKRQA